MNTKSCFIMGLPSAGKTTFLAALWHSLETGYSTSITLERFKGDLSYLSNISASWADGLAVSRTTEKDLSESSISIVLKNIDTDNIFEVSFPDLSGETFQDLYEKRVIDNDLLEYIKNCAGLLLFINFTEGMYSPQPITSIPRQFRENDNVPDSENYTERSPRKDPTQVQIVELLQFVSYIRSATPIRLGIAISLWDIIEKDPDFCNSSPKELIEGKLPLLWQFIVSNSNIFEAKYYGISAQGGDVGNKDIRVKLLEKLNPCDRIIVVDEQNKRSSDITLPIKYIVGD